jgi:hypothetical protein
MSEPIPVSTNPPVRRSVLRSVLYVLRLVAVNLLVFFVLAELVSNVLVHRRTWPSSRPTYRVNYDQFWVDINPAFGTWHRPNGHFVHQGGCFSVEYFTNSYGARDVERGLHSSKPRTLVLGDSSIEGFGVSADDRLSNILERRTGREHLNFGTSSGFGPLQYALLYKTMASAFDHDVVMVGVLPDNDFHDMDLAYWKAHGKGNVYRPYYADDFSVFYTGHFQPNPREKRWDHVEDFLRAYLASYHVGQYLYTRLYWGTFRDRFRPYSGYNDYTDVDLARLKRALQDIKSTADEHRARVAIFLIPRAIDFKRFHESKENRLGPVMESWGQEVGIPVKDLLPQMDAMSGGDYTSFYLPCDGHWSAHGGAVAADVLQPWLDYKTVAETHSNP